MHCKSWTEIKNGLLELSGDRTDEIEVLEEVWGMQWKSNEDYFHKKVRLRQQIKMKDEEMIQHLNRGINNLTVLT